MAAAQDKINTISSAITETQNFDQVGSHQRDSNFSEWLFESAVTPWLTVKQELGFNIEEATWQLKVSQLLLKKDLETGMVL